MLEKFAVLHSQKEEEEQCQLEYYGLSRDPSLSSNIYRDDRLKNTRFKLESKLFESQNP